MTVRRTLIALLAAGALAPAAQAAAFPDTIALPDEFRPEGIAAGRGADFYVGSIPLGAVWKGDFRTGAGNFLVPPHPGRTHVGLKHERTGNRLFVAGGATGIFVYDARTGADVRAYATPAEGFVNDGVVTRHGVYFTDSLLPQLYRIPIGRRGRLGELETIPLSGDVVYTEGFNANGIEATRDGKALIVAQANAGKLFRVSRRSGVAHEIALDQPVPGADGLVLRGRTLFVVRAGNQVVEVALSRRLRSGAIRRTLTDSRLDVPTTIVPFGGSLYAVNARFDRPDDSPDDIVRLR